MTNDSPSQAPPPSTPPSTGRDRISGVFSQKKIAKIGTGTTARKTELTAYFLVEERESGAIVVQPLAANDVPFGPKTEITREDLLENYLPEPQKTLARAVASLSPKDMEIQKAVARGDKFRKRGESFTAEFEYKKALQLDMRTASASSAGLPSTMAEEPPAAGSTTMVSAPRTAAVGYSAATSRVFCRAMRRA